jgi:tetratricopeptide (TPR) repeat protein
MEDLGFALHIREDFQGALQQYNEALSIYQAASSDTALDVIRCQCEIGRLCIRMSKSDQAQVILSEALERVGRLAERDRVALPAILINLAMLQRQQKKYASAQSMLVQALRWRVKNYHWKHPRVAVVFDHLSRLYWQNGMKRAAQRTIGKAMRILEEAGQERCSEYASMLNFAATMDEVDGRIDQAIARTREALGILRKVRPRTDPEAIRVRTRLRELSEIP